MDEAIEFEWDKGNAGKNLGKHGVSDKECEEVFLNKPDITADDTHSQEEKRFRASGKTNENRPLVVIFTLRKKWVRVISARDMNKKEKGEFK